jgi:hypothetical protein
MATVRTLTAATRVTSAKRQVSNFASVAFTMKTDRNKDETAPPLEVRAIPV